MREMYFWYRNDLLRNLLTLLIFFSLPVVDEKLPRFIFLTTQWMGERSNTQLLFQNRFFVFRIDEKNKTRQKNCKPISKFLTSVTPKASPCWGRRRASPSRERLYWTRKYASYEKWFRFFFCLLRRVFLLSVWNNSNFKMRGAFVAVVDFPSTSRLSSSWLFFLSVIHFPYCVHAVSILYTISTVSPTVTLLLLLLCVCVWVCCASIN